MNNEYDFGGYATRNDIRCSDGRTIRKNAFKDDDNEIIPLVWQHNHDSPENVLGHGLLENREDGVYVYGKFNDTPMGKTAKELVTHGDITRLSIFANRLKENGSDVLHGKIREVSLVFSGANDGAYIDTISFSHEDGSETTEAIIYSGEDISLEVEHSKDLDYEGVKMDKKEEKKEEDRTIQDVIDGMTDEERDVLYYLVGNALENSEDENVKHGDDFMKYNVFDGNDNKDATLSHMEALKTDSVAIFADAKRCGSLKDSFLAHSGNNDPNGGISGVDYGIKDLNAFFSDYKDVNGGPETISRDMEWVSVFMNGSSKSPFGRIKTTAIDLTDDKARALGYKKGTKKHDELVKAMKRTTDPTTVYKKSRIDRDDLVDITDWDVVAYMKNEINIMLDEELARAALTGDGRSTSDDDHIPSNYIRPIYLDSREFTRRVLIDYGVNTKSDDKAALLIDTIIRSRKLYKGSGNPILFTTDDVLSDMLLMKDTTGQYIYKSVNELATTLRVSRIVTVPVMEGLKRDFDATYIDKDVKGTPYEGKNSSKFDALAIYVNPKDYVWGMDKLGQVNFFDDFDIDYNQQKYLMEVRRSGALKKMFSAIVFETEEVSG